MIYVVTLSTTLDDLPVRVFRSKALAVEWVNSRTEGEVNALHEATSRRCGRDEASVGGFQLWGFHNDGYAVSHNVLTRGD